MKNIKSLLSAFLAVMMLLLVNVDAIYATSLDIDGNGIAKVAKIPYVSKDGSNVGTDISHPNNIVNNYDVDYSVNNNGLNISGTIEGKPFLVEASFVTTNENRNLLLYTGEDAISNFDVGYVSIERDLAQTTLYFREFQQQNPQYKNVIKLYMQPANTNSLVFIEVFITNDYVNIFKNINNVCYIAEQANILQSWFTQYYGPINVNDEEVPLTSNLGMGTAQPLANTSYGTRDLSAEYNVNGVSIKYVFKVRFYCTVADIMKGGSGDSSAYFYVEESKTVSDLAANNSSTQSYLRLESCNVKYRTMPNVILTSQTAIRNGIKKGNSISTSFSVSFGLTYGLVSGAANFNFNQNGMQNSGTVGLPYELGNNQATRATSSGVLPSGYYLQTKGSQYGIQIDYMDVGKTARSGSVAVEFTYYLHNIYEYSESGSDSHYAVYTLYVR